MKSLQTIQEAFQAPGREIFRPGARVKIAHNGRTVVGKIVRYDKGGTGPRDFGVPFYVVDVGERESKIVPAKDTTLLREDVNSKTRRYSDAEAFCDTTASLNVDKMNAHLSLVYDISKIERKLMIRKAYSEACE